MTDIIIQGIYGRMGRALVEKFLPARIAALLPVWTARRGAWERSRCTQAGRMLPATAL